MGVLGDEGDEVVVLMVGRVGQEGGEVLQFFDALLDACGVVLDDVVEVADVQHTNITTYPR